MSEGRGKVGDNLVQHFHKILDGAGDYRTLRASTLPRETTPSGYACHPSTGGEWD